MKVLIFTQHYPPDVGAQSYRMEAIVKSLSNRNHEVTIITSEPHRYSILDNKTKFSIYEKDLNLDIYRIKAGKRNDIFLKRPLNYLLFMINSWLCAINITHSKGNFDLILASSPPITSALTACIFSLFKKIYFVFEVQDLWPEVLVELKIFKNRLIINFLKYIEKKLYQKASLIIVVSEAFKDKIIDKVGKYKKIHSFPIGLDKEFILNNISNNDKNMLREKYSLPKEMVIVCYTGNIGISQNLETLVEAAKEMKEGNVLFLVVGEGLEKKKLLKISKELKIDNKIIFLNWLFKDSIKEIYTLSDILFLQLKNIEAFKLTIPSKIFEYLGSGKPIIYGLDGIAAEILRASGNGIRVKPENSNELVKSIDEIINNYDIYSDKAKEGRDFVIKNFLRDKIMDKYVKILEEIYDCGAEA